MNKVKILVVEDEFIVAEDIRRNLVKLGYEVTGISKTGEEAIAAVKLGTPDLALLDIRLGDGIDGVNVAEIIRKIVDIPLIFVTAHSDHATFERAKRTQPHAYIIKPFNFQNLHMSIELALHNYSNKIFGDPDEQVPAFDNARPLHYLINNSIFVKAGKVFEKVKLTDINYIKAHGSYSVLYANDRKFTLALNLHTVLEKIDRPEFLRTHRSYVVNLNNIERIEDNGVVIKGTLVPVTRKTKDELMRKIAAI
ncbi:MAG: response regulator [Cyclobacteriaceae bacterium]|nr:response regulator [Cyclobacteriaceae bacterium]MCB0499004.1 response regulator [Cyclobacteriaceae bacterium]MCB9238280.1 response regulator [Flammeovirgaceae bacterium]MCO5272205.1 response regulator [Cyclobacteriaceae bacterium]MCW5902680.1 response regulator [Cyclobacteriaceae bacterium]